MEKFKSHFYEKGKRSAEGEVCWGWVNWWIHSLVFSSVQADITEYHRLWGYKNNGNIFLSVLKARSQRLGDSMNGFWQRPSPELWVSVCSSYLHVAEKVWESSLGFLLKDIDLIHEAFSLWPNYFPKALPPDSIILGVKILTYEFWVGTDIQSISLQKGKRPKKCSGGRTSFRQENMLIGGKPDYMSTDVSR